MLDEPGDVVRSLLREVVPAVLEDLDLPVGPAIVGSSTCSPPTSSRGTSIVVVLSALNAMLAGSAR